MELLNANPAALRDVDDLGGEPIRYLCDLRGCKHLTSVLQIILQRVPMAGLSAIRVLSQNPSAPESAFELLLRRCPAALGQFRAQLPSSLPHLVKIKSVLTHLHDRPQPTKPSRPRVSSVKARARAFRIKPEPRAAHFQDAMIRRNVRLPKLPVPQPAATPVTGPTLAHFLPEMLGHSRR